MTSKWPSEPKRWQAHQDRWDREGGRTKQREYPDRIVALDWVLAEIQAIKDAGKVVEEGAKGENGSGVQNLPSSPRPEKKLKEWDSNPRTPKGADFSCSFA